MLAADRHDKEGKVLAGVCSARTKRLGLSLRSRLQTLRRGCSLVRKQISHRYRAESYVQGGNFGYGEKLPFVGYVVQAHSSPPASSSASSCFIPSHLFSARTLPHHRYQSRVPSHIVGGTTPRERIFVATSIDSARPMARATSIRLQKVMSSNT